MPETGTISGRVVGAYSDPIRRATVVAEVVRYSDGSTETVADTTTGDNGEFSFTGLAPGRYRLEAEKSGYVAGHFPRASSLVRLVPGDNITDVTLRMAAVAVVSGSVLDENGEPLAKAVVRLLQYKYYPGGRRLFVAREAASDERGEYRMGDLNPGRYYAVASYRSRISDTVCAPVYYPDVESFEDALPVQIHPNDEAPIKFILLPGKPVRVRGRVTGGTGLARVSLVPHGGVPYAQLLSVETSDGSFQFKDVLPGDYTVVAMSEGSDEILEGHTGITVKDHALENVSVALQDRKARHRIYVAVTSDAHGFVSRRGNVPPVVLGQKDFVVTLHRPIRSDEDSAIVAEGDVADDVEEISTRNGNPIEVPYAGPYVVSAERLSGESYIDRVEFGEMTYERWPNLAQEVLVVHLNPNGVSVDGLVVDEEDHPVAGAVVAAVPARHNEQVDQSRSTTTDQYGQFALHGLPPGSLEIYAWEEVPDGAFYDYDFLGGYKATITGNYSNDGHYHVKLHAVPADAE